MWFGYFQELTWIDIRTGASKDLDDLCIRSMKSPNISKRWWMGATNQRKEPMRLSGCVYVSGMIMIAPKLTPYALYFAKVAVLRHRFESQGFAYAIQSYNTTLLKVYSGKVLTTLELQLEHTCFQRQGAKVQRFHWVLSRCHQNHWTSKCYQRYLGVKWMQDGQILLQRSFLKSPSIYARSNQMMTLQVVSTRCTVHAQNYCMHVSQVENVRTSNNKWIWLEWSQAKLI